MNQYASTQAFDSLQDALANALVRGELYLHYQPIVDRLQKIIGMEALMRWNSVEYGPIPPSLFVPIAERSGDILSMGCLLYTSPSPRDVEESRMPSSA